MSTSDKDVLGVSRAGSPRARSWICGAPWVRPARAARTHPAAPRRGRPRCMGGSAIPRSVAAAFEVCPRRSRARSTARQGVRHCGSASLDQRFTVRSSVPPLPDTGRSAPSASRSRRGSRSRPPASKGQGSVYRIEAGTPTSYSLKIMIKGERDERVTFLGPAKLRRSSASRRLHVTVQVRRLVHAVREVEIPKPKARHVTTEGPGSPGPLTCAGAPSDPDLGAGHAIVEICHTGLAAVAARRVEPARAGGSGIHRRAVLRGLSAPAERSGPLRAARTTPASPVRS
jgi:hypothetical protein